MSRVPAYLAALMLSSALSAEPRSDEILRFDTRGPVASPRSASLERVIDRDSGAGYGARFEELRRLEVPLASADARHLRAFVREVDPLPALRATEVQALKNDILNRLIAGDPDRRALGALLLEVHRDPEQDPVMRDYALQHYASLRQTDPDITDDRAHWEAAAGPDPALAATAMLHLVVLDRRDFPLDHSRRGELGALAHALAADSAAPAPPRATALQVCARLGYAPALPTASSIARESRNPFPLRISAVAALGDLGRGDASTAAYLHSLADGSETRLRVPAQSALERLQASAR